MSKKVFKMSAISIYNVLSTYSVRPACIIKFKTGTLGNATMTCIYKICPKIMGNLEYRKVTSSSLSRLVAHSRIFRLFMKGNCDAYVM